MILKSFNIKEIKDSEAFCYLFYGENEGQKKEIFDKCFLENFSGEVVKYDETQILENSVSFFDTCLNDSLFESKKIIKVSRITSKSYEIIKEIIDRNIHNKKIILDAGQLEKKSKLRQLFEKGKNLICVPFYQDNDLSLAKIANEFFRKNQISISTQNINLIIEKCYGDRKNLQNEMAKILNYCFDKKKITTDEILKLINLKGNDNYFELIDNCLAKNQIKVTKIINDNYFGKEDSIILVRSFLSRLKRLIGLKKLSIETGSEQNAINSFKPPIFWKDKEIVMKQIKNWSMDDIYQMLDNITKLELDFKKNYEFSNNLIFDFILSASKNTNN